MWGREVSAVPGNLSHHSPPPSDASAAKTGGISQTEKNGVSGFNSIGGVPVERAAIEEVVDIVPDGDDEDGDEENPLNETGAKDDRAGFAPAGHEPEGGPRETGDADKVGEQGGIKEDVNQVAQPNGVAAHVAPERGIFLERGGEEDAAAEDGVNHTPKNGPAQAGGALGRRTGSHAVQILPILRQRQRVEELTPSWLATHV